jgi:hypothetical protein
MNDIDRLGERLARLEASNRRLKQILTIVLIVAASGVWMGQRAKKPAPKPAKPPAPRVVEAERFVLKGGDGHILGSLAIVGGGPVLSLLGQAGEDRARLSVGADGAARLALLGPAGAEPLSMSVSTAGVPLVELGAKAGSHAALTVADGEARLSLTDAAGQLRGTFTLGEEGPRLALFSKEGVERALLTTIDRGPSLALNGTDGRARLLIAVRPQQFSIGINDDRGDVRAGLAVRSNEPAFALYGANGKPLFIKP